jgi:hypothetical protein
MKQCDTEDCNKYACYETVFGNFCGSCAYRANLRTSDLHLIFGYNDPNSAYYTQKDKDNDNA